VEGPNDDALSPKVGRIAMNGTKTRILLAEDNEGDVFLVRRALEKNGVNFELEVAQNGEDAWRRLEKSDGSDGALAPDLVLLDLNLPRFDGTQILALIGESARLRTIPVVVLTSSDSLRDRDRSLSLGAQLFFRKPTELSAFMDLGRQIKNLLTATTSVAAVPK